MNMEELLGKKRTQGEEKRIRRNKNDDRRSGGVDGEKE
jgi:hypothetical protein